MTRCTMENTAQMHIGKNYKNDFAEKILSCMDMILNPSCGWQAKCLKLKLNWKINNLWSLGVFRTEKCRCCLYVGCEV